MNGPIPQPEKTIEITGFHQHSTEFAGLAHVGGGIFDQFDVGSRSMHLPLRTVELHLAFHSEAVEVVQSALMNHGNRQRRRLLVGLPSSTGYTFSLLA